MARYRPYRSDFLSHLSEVKHWLVVVAMESEEEALIAGLETRELRYGKRLPIRVRHLDWPHGRLTVARSGIGLVKAGMLLSGIVEHEPVDAVLQLGVGGALDERLEIGDTVIARQVLQHDSLAGGLAEKVWIAPGELTLSASDENQVDPFMRCDRLLVDWVKGALSGGEGKVYEGTLVSGSEFAASPARKRELRALAEDALLVDMEGAALAQVCRMLSIPFVSAKTVADRVEPGEHSVAKDYVTSLERAAARSAALLKRSSPPFG